MRDRCGLDFFIFDNWFKTYTSLEQGKSRSSVSEIFHNTERKQAIRNFNLSFCRHFWTVGLKLAKLNIKCSSQSDAQHSSSNFCLSWLNKECLVRVFKTTHLLLWFEWCILIFLINWEFRQNYYSLRQIKLKIFTSVLLIYNIRLRKYHKISYKL